MEADQAMILVANVHDLDLLTKHPFQSKFTEYSMLDFCRRDAVNLWWQLCITMVGSAPAVCRPQLLFSEGTGLCAEDLMLYNMDWNLADQRIYNEDLFATASWSLVMNSSTGITPISPLCLDLIVRVLAWTSLGPTTAMSGTFCVSAFLISFGRRSPWQTSTRNPLDFSSEATSLQYCNWKYETKMSWFHK